jgi:hypothetical protein
MRTKTLLLTAMLGVASIAAALAADPVYSVNAVGYVNVVLKKGFTIVANPLNATDNRLSKILPSTLPSGTVVFRYDSVAKGFAPAANFAPDDNGVMAWDNDYEMKPGEGFFIKNPTQADITVTFVGEVMQSTAGPLANSLVAGFNLKGSMVPQSGDLNTVLGYPAENGDTVFRFVNGAYLPAYNYAPDDNGVLNWDTVPTPTVGEGFWIKSKTAKTWNRTFTVNTP